MSTLFSDALTISRISTGSAAPDHQSDWGRSPATGWRRWWNWTERRRQRDALRELADDRHLLDDLGLTREQALNEAAKPFWR
jgi:uncharacterized protein YjiS (DUF1127 family)